jgi:NAD(P)-dependent dehydrogenase (short-subunit alcohol dehydrogenase family)
MTDGLLSGKVIVITGASTGIGADAARVCARAGARMVISARSQQRLEALADELRREGAEVEYVAGDIALADTSRRMVDTALERFGGLDGAFNNAGISGSGALVDVTEAEFDRLWNVNVKGMWLSLREEIRAIRTTGRGGSIVNTSSISGIKGSVGLGSYQATKHAVIGLTRTAAHDNGPLGIRVNAIAPGATSTETFLAWREREPEAVDSRIARIPFGRPATPSEIGEAAAWLLSDRSGTINGVVLPIDGGFSA